MLKVVVENNLSYIDGFSGVGLDEELRSLIVEYFSIPSEDAERSKEYQKGNWDGNYHFITPYGVFLSGFLPMFIRDMGEVGVGIRVEDKRDWPIQSGELSDLSSKLFDYQEEAVLLTMEHFGGCFWLATNAGKTVIMSGIAQFYKSLRVTVLCHGTNLLKQTHKALEYELKEKVGLIYQETKDIPTTRVNVASVATLHSRGWKLGEDILLYDEAHLASSNRFFSYGRASKAILRFSFSGTLRHDKEDLEAFGLSRYSYRDARLMGLTGPVLMRLSNLDLVRMGVSAVPKVKLYPFQTFQTLDYKWAEEHCIVKSTKFNSFIVSLAKSLQGNVLVVVKLIDHGKILSEALGCRFVYGKTKDEKRTFLEGETLLVGNKVIETGINTQIDHIIFAWGGRASNDQKNAIRLLQVAGRGFRKKKGENVVHFHDVMVMGNEWLEKHSEERLNTWSEEGIEIEVVEDFEVGHAVSYK